jgi:hypothetical protein
MDIGRPRVSIQSARPTTKGAEAAVTGVDFIGTFNSFMADDRIVRFIINPANSETFPRASAGANMWRRYCIKKLQFLVFGINAATQGGFVAMSSLITDDLATHIAPDSENEILNMENATVVRPWTGGVHQVHLESHGLRWYTLDSSLTDPTSLFGENMGSAYLFIPQTTADDDIVIQVYVKYTIDYSIRVPVTLATSESYMDTAGTLASIIEENHPVAVSVDSPASVVIRSILPLAWSNVDNSEVRSPSDFFAWLYSSFTTLELEDASKEYSVLSGAASAVGDAIGSVLDWATYAADAWAYSDANTIVSDAFRANFMTQAYDGGDAAGSSIIDAILAGLGSTEVDNIITGLGGTPGPLTRVEAYKASRQRQGKEFSLDQMNFGKPIPYNRDVPSFKDVNPHGFRHVTKEGVRAAKKRSKAFLGKSSKTSKEPSPFSAVGKAERSKCVGPLAEESPTLREVAESDSTEVLKEELRCLRDQLRLYQQIDRISNLPKDS